MGTIKCGFWTFRFLISPAEFSTWIDFLEKEGFSFKSKQGDIKLQFERFYHARMDTAILHRICPLVNAGIIKENFKSAFHITSGQRWRFCYKSGETSLDAMFLQLSAPKQCIPSDNSSHFTLEDIQQEEADTKMYFGRVTRPLNAITKPLYQGGKPMYSVRISQQADKDLRNSAFYKELQEGMTSSWQQRP